MTRKAPIPLGISACLLGHRVRYDGGHKHAPTLVDTLAPYVVWVPVCPEVEAGLPIPREPMDLAGPVTAPRVVGTESGTDFTDRLEAWTRGRLDGLAGENLGGFAFKARSPSCGRTKGGIFARRFGERFPLLPMAEEGELADPEAASHFIERLFAACRWREFTERVPTPGRLIAFHAASKYQLMAHAPDSAHELGALVGSASDRPLGETIAAYGALFAEVLSRPTTTAGHVNTLQHLAGYFKRLLAAGERADLAALIERYRLGREPLAAPLARLAELARHHDLPYLLGQTYLTLPAAATGDPGRLAAQNFLE